ncbi:MAG: MBL fold metallo-hydrolase [Desulfovibrio sp.]|jgi:glyoxylase-like metal-dependent hydrolase (beta-lactamase superfamily II)|nr:MBL fold metallo-hydrolase [Desulfovibrio sp.]
MQVAVFPLGPLETNCLVIYTDDEAVAVDPGGDPKAVLRMLGERKLRLGHILLTHLHFDHTFGVAPLAAATGATVLGPEGDRYMLADELGMGGTWGLPKVPRYEFSSLQPGDIPLLGTVCRVIATPGHTPGSLSFYFSELGAVFSGDTLFYRSIGRSDFPGGNHAVLCASIRDKLFTLPDATAVYSGHGPVTRIADEKRSNPFVGMFSL